MCIYRKRHPYKKKKKEKGNRKILMDNAKYTFMSSKSD